jgi:hypothetical protein
MQHGSASYNPAYSSAYHTDQPGIDSHSGVTDIPNGMQCLVGINQLRVHQKVELLEGIGENAAKNICMFSLHIIKFMIPFLDLFT